MLQIKTLNRLEKYLKLMQSYYDTETSIRNIYQERSGLIQDLIVVSRSYDQENFETKGIRLLLAIRVLTVKLTDTVKRWKSMLQRATATFDIEDAWQGNKIGMVMYKDERIEKRQLYSSLKPSSRLDQAKRRSAVSSSRKKNSDLSLKPNDQQQCILCHIATDNYLKKNSGLLLKKLQHFLKDLVLF